MKVSNVEFFQFADRTVGVDRINNHVPVVTVSDFAASHGQVINASSLFSASDADSDTLTYYFIDNTPDAASGHFTLNGAAQSALVVTAAQLAQTTFTAGSISDDLFVNVFDGIDFGQAKEFHVNVPPNHAPVVTASDGAASRGQVIPASSLFSARDADGDALSYYLYDGTPDAASGHFMLNGMAQSGLVVTAAQLAQTTFTAGSISDDLFVNVFDGIDFGQAKEFHVNLPSNHAPVVTAPDFTATAGQVIPAASLFSASDVNGGSLTYYLYDSTSGGGHFTVNGTEQSAAVVTAAQLAQTTFTAGGPGASDDLFVNVYDGIAFGQPQEFSRQRPNWHEPSCRRRYEPASVLS